MSDLTATVASWADRDDLVVELADSGEDWGDVTYDPTTGKVILTLYPRPTGEEWVFDLQDVVDILAIAAREIQDVAGSAQEERDGHARSGNVATSASPAGD